MFLGKIPTKKNKIVFFPGRGDFLTIFTVIQVTERSLPHQPTKEHEDIASKAGSEEEVGAIRQNLVDLDIITCFHNIIDHLRKEAYKLKELGKPMAKLSDKVSQDLSQVKKNIFHAT